MPGKLDPQLMEYLPWMVTGVVGVFVLALIFVYVAAVFRFILFEAVLYDRSELMKGWRRWQRQGTSYFLWTIGFGLACLTVMVVLIGGPIYLAWLAGIFVQPGNHIALIVIGGVLLFLVAAVLIVTSAVASLLAKDFVVPVMALEDRKVLDGWRRLFPMLGAEKGAFTIYVLMKIVLAVGSAVIFGIIDFLVLFALLIPLGIVAVVVVLVAIALGLSWTPLTVGAAVIACGAVLLLLVYVISFVSAPAMVFFQAYTLHFFGSRYPLLGDQLALTSVASKPAPLFPPAGAPLPAS